MTAERLQRLARSWAHIRGNDPVALAPAPIDQYHVIAELQRQIDELKGQAS